LYTWSTFSLAWSTITSSAAAAASSASISAARALFSVSFPSLLGRRLACCALRRAPRIELSAEARLRRTRVLEALRHAFVEAAQRLAHTGRRAQRPQLAHEQRGVGAPLPAEEALRRQVLLQSALAPPDVQRVERLQQRRRKRLRLGRYA